MIIFSQSLDPEPEPDPILFLDPDALKQIMSDSGRSGSGSTRLVLLWCGET
jgi:hypothetical protein